MKITLRNNSQVSVGGQLPGATFRVEALNETTPTDRFWRKMLKNSDGIVIAEETSKEAKRETLTLKPNNDASPKKPSIKKEVAA